jgi:hypothetical protein
VHWQRTASSRRGGPGAIEKTSPVGRTKVPIIKLSAHKFRKLNYQQRHVCRGARGGNAALSLSPRSSCVTFNDGPTLRKRR